MRSKFTSPFFLTISGVLVLILLWAWVRSDEPSSTNGDQASEQQVVETSRLSPAETESSTIDGQDPAPPEQAPSAVSNPGEPSPADSAASTEKDPAESLADEELIVLQDVETDLIAALAGDNNVAVALSGFLNECQLTFRNRSRVEHSIARAERSFAEGKSLTRFRPSGPAEQFESLEAFQNDQWHTFFRCEATRTLITDEFWNRLELEADSGNPAARYLFATVMRESPSRAFAFDRWDEELQLREQAREYTLRNLEEREPLGLLALASAEGESMRFTAGRTSMGGVLVLAAIKCGLSTPELLQSADQILQHVQNLAGTKPELLAQLNDASDEARQMFCK